mmetsp:Transcript_29230/g.100928  ORF Transcript_29230/g.100928 Transcript_29230/m.100928 type:complete len:223 (+) Transcript_29230:29-697(+)
MRPGGRGPAMRQLSWMSDTVLSSKAPRAGSSSRPPRGLLSDRTPAGAVRAPPRGRYAASSSSESASWSSFSATTAWRWSMMRSSERTFDRAAPAWSRAAATSSSARASLRCSVAVITRSILAASRSHSRRASASRSASVCVAASAPTTRASRRRSCVCCASTRARSSATSVVETQRSFARAASLAITAAASVSAPLSKDLCASKTLFAQPSARPPDAMFSDM